MHEPSLAEIAIALNHVLDREASYNELLLLRENRERIFTAMRVAESRMVTDAQRKLNAISALHRLSPIPNGKGVTGEWCICGHVRCKERAILEEQPAAEGAP